MTPLKRFPNVICVLAVLLFCGLSLKAQPASKAWEELGLESIHLDRATVYYETAFEPNLPFFKQAFSDLLVSWDNNKAAKRIISLVDNRESKPYQLASSILAFHPGQPDSKASR